MPVFMKMDGIDSIGPENSAKDGTSNTLMIGEHVPTSVEHAVTYGAAASPSQAFNEPNADRHEFAIKKVVDAPSPTVAPDIDDEVLVFSHDERSNNSIWIDIGAPIMRAFEGSREYVLTQPEHAATDEAQSSRQSPDTGIVLPNHFGGCGRSRKPFVRRELNDALRGVRRAVGRGSNFRRGGCRQSARCPDRRMDRRCDLRAPR